MEFGKVMKKNQEIEAKLQIKNEDEVGKISAWLKSISNGKLQNIEMKAVYYDTEDGFFNRNKIAYRVRRENNSIVATYKSGNMNKNGIFERVEINKVAKSVEPDITVFADEASIWEIVKTVESVDLKPIVVTDFVRECAVIEWQNSQVEIALDQGTVWGKNNKSPICELELELKDGNENDLLDLKTKLMQRFAIENSVISKYKKGLILAGLS